MAIYSRTIIKNNLWCAEGVMDKKVCNFLIDHAYERASNGNPKWEFKPCGFNGNPETDIRNSCEIRIREKSFRTLIWSFAKNHVSCMYQGRKLVGPDSNSFYLLRYEPGQKFEQHRDGHSVDYKGRKSFVTALIYLNKCEQGGETRFFEEPMMGMSFKRSFGRCIYDCEPEIGKLVLMRHYLLHQALPVVEGVKYVLRFNIVYEKFGEWYNGPSCPEKKLSGEPSYERPEGCPRRVYKFLIGSEEGSWEPGRLPEEGEDRCENCYEILDLTYDYYTCPGCNYPVCDTDR